MLTIEFGNSQDVCGGFFLVVPMAIQRKANFSLSAPPPRVSVVGVAALSALFVRQILHILGYPN